ncbi:adenine nucleotide alpha hydrolases-like protein [Dendrothele bispora CBS 962.96]|uniref:tRNA(Ile)-lysidine synthetase n=1 Tax=Dendrothele bispora (strain CBS 962.96) TaxID=1314807 RepID=A0A4S8MWN8_DENBC|nr:adenine nucleotide alpha hydrolases-like protein [Dendrothele bispora CBS 962.96]
MNIFKRAASPISSEEFAKVFRRCRPPTGWPETIAISNSGGPDSTCLLFLIQRYLSENTQATELPRRAVSIHIDHGLQECSGSMAKRCAAAAKSIGVEHYTYKIPWSQNSWPEKPQKSTFFENNARTARYRKIYEAMSDVDAKIIAMGHHKDDQVETMLMRVMKGSTSDGASGMKYIRRWGMGLGVSGLLGISTGSAHEGMRRWIIRPLLSLPKDRIYITCKHHNLSYVTDPTNLDEGLAIRNSLRKWLNDPSQLDYPFSAEALQALDKHGIDLSTGKDQVYPILQELASESENIDQEVDSIFNRNTLRSPVGTYLISCSSLSSITDLRVKRALILRILRYVSFFPWGSLYAQAHRRRHSLEQIIEKLWTSHPFQANIAPFCAGAGVGWTPVVIQGDQFRTPTRRLYDAHANSPAGWLAFRQAPSQNFINSEYWSPLEVNVTQFLAEKLAYSQKTAEFLYDSRFLVTFDLTKIPLDIQQALNNPQSNAAIWVKHRARWFWPVVVLRKDGQDTDIHFKVTLEETDLLGSLKKDIWWRKVENEVESSWVTTKFIRVLSAL